MYVDPMPVELLKVDLGIAKAELKLFGVVYAANMARNMSTSASISSAHEAVRASRKLILLDVAR